MILGTAEYLAAWLRAFVFTQVVEILVYRLAGKIRVAPAFTASAITHPAVWFIFPTLGIYRGWSFYSMVSVAEVFAWLTEALFLWSVVRVKPMRALVIALAANAASVVCGEGMRWATFKMLGRAYP
jgi:hypothetical protein